MNLRQKIAWLLLAIFLGSTFAFVYYLLDIADQYMLFSIQHSKLHQDASSENILPAQESLVPLDPQKHNIVMGLQVRTVDGTSGHSSHGGSSFWHHIVDIPMPLLAIFGIVTYCQTFAFLFYFTLPHIPSFRDVSIWTIPFLGWFYIGHRMKTLLCCYLSSRVSSPREGVLHKEEGKATSYS